MMDMLTGPHSYIPGVTFIDVNGNNIYENGIDTPLDTAVNYLGPIGITNLSRVQKIWKLILQFIKLEEILI